MKRLKEFLNRDWSMAEKILVKLVCFLIGVILGFIMSPVKHGISFGNNNTVLQDDKKNQKCGKGKIHD